MCNVDTLSSIGHAQTFGFGIFRFFFFFLSLQFAKKAMLPKCCLSVILSTSRDALIRYTPTSLDIFQFISFPSLIG